MIRRLFYMGLGAFATVWAQRKLAALRPDHVARRAAGQARLFADDVRSHALTRETELRDVYLPGTVARKPLARNPYEKDGR